MAATSAPTAEDLVARVAGALSAAADPEQAGPMAAYMRDQFPFLGIKGPTRRDLVRPMLTVSRGMPADEVLSAADALWARDEREYQYVACDLLARHATRLDHSALAALRRLVATKSWWDTVDALASRTVGPIVRRHRECARVMDRWVTDDDIWVARAAVLHQLGWKEGTDTGRLFDYCARRADHPDFFMRKAIGWALRDYARTDPDSVARFVAGHRDTLSTLSVREACKHIGVPS